MSGKKFDENKLDLSLIPFSALQQEAMGFMLGARKYGKWNYTKGMEASRLVAAALRHIHAWNQGENLDPESGASHLGHARCCLAMLLECNRVGTLKDDRQELIVLGDKPDIQKNLEIRKSYEKTWTGRLADGSEVEWGTGSADLLDHIK